MFLLGSYGHSSYVLDEDSGYVELCVKVTSPGISADLYVELNIHNNTGEFTILV